jgi:hypothetical protein
MEAEQSSETFVSNHHTTRRNTTENHEFLLQLFFSVVFPHPTAALSQVEQLSKEIQLIQILQNNIGMKREKDWFFLILL